MLKVVFFANGKRGTHKYPHNKECTSIPTTRNARHTRRDKEKYPEKFGSRTIVRQAIKNGKLKPIEYCEMCFSEDKIEAHHPDHSEPLLLIFLCPKCHRKADGAPCKWIDIATDYSECIK